MPFLFNPSIFGYGFKMLARGGVVKPDVQTSMCTGKDYAINHFFRTPCYFFKALILL